MKTYCNSCNTSSVNFLRRETGTAYCSSCGVALTLSIEIVNALSLKKMFFPEGFFDVEVAQTPPVQLQTAPAVVSRPVDPHAAALARREYYTNATTPDDGSARTIKIPKVTREQAAAAKAQLLAQADAIAAEASVQSAQANWFKNKPSLSRDVESVAGVSLETLEKLIDSGS